MRSGFDLDIFPDMIVPTLQNSERGGFRLDASYVMMSSRRIHGVGV